MTPKQRFDAQAPAAKAGVRAVVARALGKPVANQTAAHQTSIAAARKAQANAMGRKPNLSTYASPGTVAPRAPKPSAMIGAQPGKVSSFSPANRAAAKVSAATKLGAVKTQPIGKPLAAKKGLVRRSGKKG